MIEIRRRRRSPRSLILLAVLSVAAQGGAQTIDRTQKITPLDPVVVTATRTREPIASVLADMTVIERDAIARAGVESLAELLQRQPGLQIIQNGGPGSTSGVFIRGTNTGQTLVLIDGVRVSSSTSGTTALEAIPLEQIERIEILRGPASSLYGSDAIGGVIQVFTRRGAGALRATGGAGFGTYGTWALEGGVSGTTAPFAYALHLGGKKSDGFNAIVNPNSFFYDPDRDGYDNFSATASGSVTFATDQSLSMSYFRNRLNNQFDAGDSFDDRTITTLETWQVDSRNRIAPFWVSRLSAAQGTDDSVTETAFGDAPFRTRQRQYTWQNDLILPAGGLVVALERREERVDTDPPFPVTSRNTNSITGIYQWRDDPHALQANVRYDDSNQFGGKTTGALAYGYRWSPEWRFIASGGTAFKAPSFNDLYFPGFSNPDLKPETSQSVEAGAYWGRAFDAGGTRIAVDAGAVAWRNRVEDLIVFQCDVNFDCKPNNVDTATLTGVTLTADVRIGDATTLTGSLDIQSPDNDTNGKQLPRRARQYGTFTVTQFVGALRLGAEVVASSYRYDDAENLRRLGGYAILNLTAEWPFAQNWTLYVRGDNVFDKDYQLAADYSTGGARWFAGVRGRL